MKAKILKHRAKEGFHGLINNGVLYASDFIVPKLYPVDWDDTRFLQIIIVCCPGVQYSDFDIIEVEITPVINEKNALQFYLDDFTFRRDLFEAIRSGIQDDFCKFNDADEIISDLDNPACATEAVMEVLKKHIPTWKILA